MSDVRWQRGDERDLYTVLAEMEAAGQPGVLATVIGAERSTPRHLGSKMIIHPDGRVTGSIGGGRAEAAVVAEARRVLAEGVCRRLSLALRGELAACGGDLEVFLEPVGRSEPFWICGAGHIGRAFVRLGAGLAWRFVLVDDRPEFLTGISGAEVLQAQPQELAEHLAVTPRTAVLIASRDHALDRQYLAAVLAAEAKAQREIPYVGVIASANKAAKIVAELGADDRLRERCARLQMPAGLAVGAETPAEIALSILAEALAIARRVPLIDDDSQQGVYFQRRRPQRATADRPRQP